MEEVKAREEEYETIKSVQSRMKGLPDGFVLASRKRRLLGQGVMHRVQFSEKDFPSATSSSANSRNGNTHPPSTSSPPMPNIAKLFPVTLTPSSQPPYSARSATHPVPGLPANTASSAHTRPAPPSLPPSLPLRCSLETLALTSLERTPSLLPALPLLTPTILATHLALSLHFQTGDRL
jgi:hypothetical protein